METLREVTGLPCAVGFVVGLSVTSAPFPRLGSPLLSLGFFLRISQTGGGACQRPVGSGFLFCQRLSHGYNLHTLSAMCRVFARRVPYKVAGNALFFRGKKF
jgi:hypothetical protein